MFVVANVAMLFLYRQKVLPNYSLGTYPIGGVAFSQLDARVQIEQLLPAKIKLIKNDKTAQLSPRDLGITVDWTQTKQHLQASRSWLPLVSLVAHRHVPVELRIAEPTFEAAQAQLDQTFTKPALPERVVFAGSAFAIAAPEDGFVVDDARLQATLVTELEQAKQQIVVPVTVTHTTEPTGTLTGELNRLQKSLSAKITLTDGTHHQQLTAGEIGQFYQPAGQTMQFSVTKAAEIIADTVKTWDFVPVNQGQAATAAEYAINKAQAITFRLADKNIRIYRYCTSVKGGVSESNLPEFRQKLAAVYGDPRSWNQAGIAFVHDETNCDYTAWLSSAAAMTTFSSSICDNYYSCRVGRNVIINYDRWLGATDPWNAAHGSLQDYRDMVINHETGHWLGFAHRFCPGPGQPAPVMQQQSIDLQGCAFNPWPTPAEISAL